MKNIYIVVMIVALCIVGLALRQSNVLIKASSLESKEWTGNKDFQASPLLASFRRSGSINSRTVGQKSSALTLHEVRDFATTYIGPETKRKIEDGSARPLSLAAGDLDEDGVPDLVCAYMGDDANLLAVHRGNVDAIYGNTPEATERRKLGEYTDAPFFSAATVFELPERPDMIGTGDFNADGHRDIVVAALGSQRLYWLAGNGKGGLGETQAIDLSGKVTAMTIGEINRADGLDDVIVGVDGGSGTQVLVYESADGAFKSEPEALTLPQAANSLALGQLDDGYEMDLAVAAGTDLVIVHGRDRRTSLDQEARSEVLAAEIDEQAMRFPITSLAIGVFVSDHQKEIALLSADGVLHVVERTPDGGRWGTIIGDVATGVSTDLNRCSSDITRTSVCTAPTLVRARVSVSGRDDLVVVNPGDHQLQIIATEAPQAKGHADRTSSSPTMRVTASLDMASDPVAVLPMRLNIDAFSDLVVLKNGGDAALGVGMTAPLRTFTVNSSGDQNDINLGDGKCETAANNNICTLKAAVAEVNAGPGGDTITFSVSSVTAVGGFSMQKSMTIDGGSSRVEINRGFSATSGNNGNHVLRSLVINNLNGGLAIDLEGTVGNIFVEGCYIGTDVSGSNAAFGTSSWSGIAIGGSFGSPPNNTVGGTTAAARNVISAPSVGIAITTQSVGNKVQGNYIGTNALGTTALGNNSSGISVNGTNTTIGGSVFGAGNLISCNSTSLCTNVSVGGSGILVQGNLIGTDAGGNVALNSTKSLGVQTGAGLNGITIGGTTFSARNIISGNTFSSGYGIGVNSPTLIQGNYIGTDKNGTTAIPNTTGILISNSGSGTTVGGAAEGARNVISGNSGTSIAIGTGGNNNVVQRNYIGTDFNGTADLGNGNGIFVNGDNNQIGGTGTDTANIIAFTHANTGGTLGSGVRIFQGTGNSVRRNSIFGNAKQAILSDANSADKAPVLSGTTGTLTGARANTPFTIEFFSNDSCGSSGTQQAKNYIAGGDVTFTTDANGNRTFNVPAGQNVTAAANPTGQNTSSISNCIAGAATPTPTPTPTPALSDLELRFNPASPPPPKIFLGSLSDGGTYSIMVTNNGPAKAFAVTVSGSLPANTSLGTDTASFCTATGPGTTFTCALGDLDAAPVPHATSGPGVKVFDLVLKPTTLGTITLTPSVTLDTSKTTDNVSSNNSVTTTTAVVVKVDLIGFEVTQAIQDLQNSVPLIADKPTFIRAYLSNDKLDPVTGVAVTASLVGTNSNAGGVTNGTFPASNPGKRITLIAEPKRAVLQDSFYFELPPNWVKAGTLQFKIQSPDLEFTCAERDATPDCSTTVTFQKMNKLSINFVAVTWKDAANVSHTPVANDILLTMSEIKARFPMSEFDVDFSSTNITDNPCGAALTPILESIEILRKEDIRNGKTVKKYYMGLIADQNACGAGFGNNGEAYISGNSSIVFLMRNGLGGFPVMDGNSRAHELAHNTGVRHTRSSKGEVILADDFLPADGRISTGRAEYGPDTAYGFDIFDLSSNRDGARIFVPTTYDSMSYERPRWMSVHNYKKLFTSLGVSTGARPEIDPNAVMVTQSVIVSGTLSSNPESGTIAPLFVKSSNAAITLPTPGSYEMRLENAAGQLLTSYSFEPQLNSEGGKESYSLVLPWDPIAKRLRLMHNGQELASRTASDNPPTVTVTSPNGGETLTGSTATFTWTASDSDGNPLSYVIDYSPDAGTTWSALATGVASTSYTADISKLAASTQALIRVSASDGFNSTTDPSNAVFTVSPHAPAASISSPENNHMYVGDQAITLNGMGIDTEDGILDSSRLTWSSNLNGTLGTGNSLSINASTLAEGTHTITLTARDSTLGVGTATITIKVFRTAPVLPATLAIGPTGVALKARFGTVLSSPETIAIRNSGDGALTWSATVDQSWIKLASAGGAAPSNLSITADPTGLAIGQYTGHVAIASTGAVNSPQNVSVSLTVSPRTIADFDGDGKSDVAVFRESEGNWYYLNSAGNTFGGVHFGAVGDRIVPGDYDGDGRTDFGVWRSGTWYLLTATGSFTGVPFGLPTDLPAQGDYDNDGKTDIAVWRPSNGTWFLQQSTAGFSAVQFGASGDRPVPGDYDGDGKTDQAVFRPSEGNWYLLQSTAGFGGIHFGIPTDKVVPADFDGDGKTDVAVFRVDGTGQGVWFLLQSTAGFAVIPFGTTNDIPAPGDFDGDSKADTTVFRPSNGIWFSQQTTSGFVATQFGQNGDKPVPAGYVPVQ